MVKKILWGEKENRYVPTPGIEPGPRRWERRILTTRPYGTHTHYKENKYYIFLLLFKRSIL